MLLAFLYWGRRWIPLDDRTRRRGLGGSSTTGSTSIGPRSAFMSDTATVVIFTVLAVIALVADKLPTTPSRLGLPGLTARVITGALSGASVAAAAAQSVQLGAVLGVAGGIAGAFVGYGVRSRLVRRLKVPDWVIGFGGGRGCDWRRPIRCVAVLVALSMDCTGAKQALDRQSTAGLPPALVMIGTATQTCREC